MSSGIESVFSLDGRTAVVTGAASGIGRAVAKTLAEAGAGVVLADVDLAGLEHVRNEIDSSGRSALCVEVDVSSRSEVEKLVAAALDRFGSVDVMANVAGIIRNASVIETTEEELDAVLAVNLKGVFFGCQAAARVMVEQGGGSIINVASAGMDMPAPGIVSYAMSKAAVAMLTRTLAVEVGGSNVRVNTVAPGFTDTSMTRRHFTDAGGKVDEDARDRLWNERASGAPLGRIGEPEDIAWAILYLASDAARFVTGQVLRPNGGVVMP
ncbi:SDR family oxidoreductase [Myxococcota bacterium]|nr:SDR family oxidoreductase [Myxococcota bacterium]